jgi:hypothetical protein
VSSTGRTNANRWRDRSRAGKQAETDHLVEQILELVNVEDDRRSVHGCSCVGQVDEVNGEGHLADELTLDRQRVHLD